MTQTEETAASPLLLVSCIDYRFVIPTAKYMADHGFAGNYYHIGVAGASLGSNRYPDSFTGQLEVLRSSGVRPERIIVMDHLDCAAYKVWLGSDAPELHERELCKLHTRIVEFYGPVTPPIETLIMTDVEGHTDPVHCLTN